MRFNIVKACAFVLCASLLALTQDASHDGLGNNLSNLYRLSNAKTFFDKPPRT
jgi:hypothetical protein